MKKAISTIALLAVVSMTTSFVSYRAAPKLYPELEAYFKSIDAKQYAKDQFSILENVRHNLTASDMDYMNWNCIFYCTENSFRSQASQVFLETLCYAKKHKKVKVFSAGVQASEINPKLIAYLSKIGYKVSKTNMEGKTAYEVKFSDDAKPILLYSKNVTDKSLPTSEVTSVIVCNRETEPICKDLKTEIRPFEIPFPNVGATDSDEKIESTLRSIAVAMQFMTEKKAVK